MSGNASQCCCGPGCLFCRGCCYSCDCTATITYAITDPYPFTDSGADGNTIPPEWISRSETVPLDCAADVSPVLDEVALWWPTDYGSPPPDHLVAFRFCNPSNIGGTGTPDTQNLQWGIGTTTQITGDNGYAVSLAVQSFPNPSVIVQKDCCGLVITNVLIQVTFGKDFPGGGHHDDFAQVSGLGDASVIINGNHCCYDADLAECVEGVPECDGTCGLP